MWNGKNKAFTMSFDDGVVQDRRAVALFDTYGLKATFNLNSGLLGTVGKISASEVRMLYKNHEVAAHTLSHPNLTHLSDDDVAYQSEEDRILLSKLCGYEVKGMAYPCGGVNNDDRVAAVLREKTGIKYSRTIASTYSFALPQNPLRLNPTVYYVEIDELFELSEKFIDSDAREPQLFYVWGHTFETENGAGQSWNLLEKFCKTISHRSDIFYGTNYEILKDLL